MTILPNVHVLKGLRQRRKPGHAMTIGGPRWNRLLERQRLSSEAMAVARSFNSTLATIEQQIADLRAAMDRGDDGAARPVASVNADHLLHSIYSQQVAFAEATQVLAPSVAANDRIHDTRKALSNAATAIELIQKKLTKRHRRLP